MVDVLVGLERPFGRGRTWAWTSAIHANLGNRDRAIALLREAMAEGLTFNPGFHGNIPLAPLQGYPPFEALMRPRG